jgi:tRNA A37 threonylcarbamoyladenosine dehydratase
MEEYFDRSVAALGEKTFLQLKDAKIAIFGIGGVGGWCAEALVRTGAANITLVDCDVVQPSNINRQVMATPLTIGQVKVEAMKNHLQTINPNADIIAINKRFSSETVEDFDLSSYDFVIDAIDSVQDKALLITKTLALKKVKLFSSMGAAMRFDPTRVKKTKFKKVTGDGLARALRMRFKKNGLTSLPDFTCVWSDEIPSPTHEPMTKLPSLMQVTAAFGLTLASLVIDSVRK